MMEQLTTIDLGDSPPAKYHWQMAESEEWYTPPYVVEIYRKTVGGTIAFDPATNPLAQTIIKADIALGIEDNGLGPNAWRGPLWSNFPYGWMGDPFSGKRVSSVETWSRRLVQEMKRGHVAESATLIGSRHLNLDPIQELIRGDCGPAACLYFDHRIKFLRIPGNKIGILDHADQLEESQGPTGNNVMVYVGPNTGKFYHYGSKHGAVQISVDSLLFNRGSYVRTMDQIEELESKSGLQSESEFDFAMSIKRG